MPSMQKRIYEVEGLYGDDPDNWTVWRRNLTKGEALDLLKTGNSSTKGLRAVRVSKTVLEEHYPISNKFKPQVDYINFQGLRPLSVEVTATHVRLSIHWNKRQRSVSFQHETFKTSSDQALSVLCFKDSLPLLGKELKVIRSKVQALIKIGSW